MALKQRIANIEENAIRLLTTGYCDKHVQEIRKMSFDEFIKQQKCPLCIELERKTTSCEKK